MADTGDTKGGNGGTHQTATDTTPTIGELGTKLADWISKHPFESLAFGVLGAIVLTAGRRW